MKRYPRMGCLFGEEFFKAVGIESDHHFFANHQSWCRAALIDVDQFSDSFSVPAHVSFYELIAFLRKVALGPVARRSAGLREKNNRFSHRVWNILRAETLHYFSTHDDFKGDFCRLLQHSFHRTVLLHR
jgi:hypothetical protein